MSKIEPKIQKFMTCQPHAIESGEILSEAVKMMTSLNIRHLPVMENGEVSGILSERDIKTALSCMGTKPEELKVADVCHLHPYIVDPDTRLHDVVDEMAAHHYGCAIVVQNKKLVGIFTAVDACRTISALLEQRVHRH